MQCSIKEVGAALVIALIAHGIGVYYGSIKAVCVNQTVLKRGIAIFSILIAACKLGGVF